MGQPPAEKIATGRPNPARMYDYYLGGTDNYKADREAAQRVIDAIPDVIPTAVGNREFLRRAVRFVAEHGIRQFIDIGTGIPTSPNTHEIARAVSPDVKVAYLDNAPIVAPTPGPGSPTPATPASSSPTYANPAASWRIPRSVPRSTSGSRSP